MGKGKLFVILLVCSGVYGDHLGPISIPRKGEASCNPEQYERLIDTLAEIRSAESAQKKLSENRQNELAELLQQYPAECLSAPDKEKVIRTFARLRRFPCDLRKLLGMPLSTARLPLLEIYPENHGCPECGQQETSLIRQSIREEDPAKQYFLAREGTVFAETVGPNWSLEEDFPFFFSVSFQIQQALEKKRPLNSVLAKLPNFLENLKPGSQFETVWQQVSQANASTWTGATKDVAADFSKLAQMKNPSQRRQFIFRFLQSAKNTEGWAPLFNALAKQYLALAKEPANEFNYQVPGLSLAEKAAKGPLNAADSWEFENIYYVNWRNLAFAHHIAQIFCLAAGQHVKVIVGTRHMMGLAALLQDMLKRSYGESIPVKSNPAILAHSAHPELDRPEDGPLLRGYLESQKK